MICPVCEAENPKDAAYCGLCLHDFGSYYSKGLVKPPDWYSPSNYKMIYSESAYISSRIKTQTPEDKEKPALKKSNPAQLHRMSNNQDREAGPSPWF
ncbi:MAG: hypothetical protein JW738_06745 [Actinobacteria bacterium]|nr:hypothetical protein [Actinomycetota bacterium]